MNALPQLGVLGCSRAQDNEPIPGCADAVTTEIDRTRRGRVSGLFGCKIGEMNSLVRSAKVPDHPNNPTYGHRRSAIDPRESMISVFGGQ